MSQLLLLPLALVLASCGSQPAPEPAYDKARWEASLRDLQDEVEFGNIAQRNDMDVFVDRYLENLKRWQDQPGMVCHQSRGWTICNPKE